jgi:N-acetyltransferase
MKTTYQSLFPASLELETPRIVLRLLRGEDGQALSAISGDSRIWTYFTRNLALESEMKAWIAAALEERAAEKRMPFAVMDKETRRLCGSTSLGNISFYDKRVEIGWSWLGTEFMGTGINHHAKFLLLSYAFEVMGMERVEIKTDNLNERSKAALRKIGAREEGVLRSHMLMFDGRRRDSVYFSILKPEWEGVKYLFFGDMV